MRLATHTETKLKYAMKIIDKEKVKKEDLLENLKREVGIMMAINHTNIVRLYEVLASKTKMYLVLEYIEGGELWQIIGKIRNIQCYLILKLANEKLMRMKPKNILNK